MKKIGFGIAGLALLIVIGSVVATEISNAGGAPIGFSEPGVVDPSQIAKQVIEDRVKQLEAKRGQPAIAGLRFGMTLAEVQAVLGPGHSAYSADGTIFVEPDQFKGRFPLPGDPSHEVEVMFIRGGLYEATSVQKGSDSFAGNLPGGGGR